MSHANFVWNNVRIENLMKKGTKLTSLCLFGEGISLTDVVVNTLCVKLSEARCQNEKATIIPSLGIVVYAVPLSLVLSLSLSLARSPLHGLSSWPFNVRCSKSFMATSDDSSVDR